MSHSLLVGTLLTFAFTFGVQASSSQKLKTQKNETQGFIAVVRYGDKISKFELRCEDKIFSFAADGQKAKKTKLSDDNYKFLNEKAAENLNLSKNDISLCPRNFIEISGRLNGKILKNIACIASKNKTTKSFTEFVNTLNLLL